MCLNWTIQNVVRLLDTVLDWNTRKPAEKGDPDHPLYDGLPGNNRYQYSHHDGGEPEANINPDTVLTMITAYNKAKEEQAKEAAKVEGDPIAPTTPVPADGRKAGCMG